MTAERSSQVATLLPVSMTIWSAWSRTTVVAATSALGEVLRERPLKSCDMPSVLVDQVRTPEPSVVNAWPLDPSAEGRVYFTLLKMRLPEIEAVPENEAVALTSRSPLTNTSLDVDM